MNLVRSGSQRDRRILDLVEARHALTAEQVSILLFPMKAGHRKAQQRLKRLYDTESLLRARFAQDEGFAYYMGRRPSRLDHLIALNWVYVWQARRLPSWGSIVGWEYEPSYEVLRADAFFGVHNGVTGKDTFCFVELDRAGSGNPFDKVSLYNRLYKSNGYAAAWWVEKAERFPTVLCVTDSAARLSAIRKAIERENANGLRFDVRLLADVRGEAGK